MVLHADSHHLHAVMPTVFFFCKSRKIAQKTKITWERCFYSFIHISPLLLLAVMTACCTTGFQGSQHITAWWNSHLHVIINTPLLHGQWPSFHLSLNQYDNFTSSLTCLHNKYRKKKATHEERNWGNLRKKNTKQYNENIFYCYGHTDAHLLKNGHNKQDSEILQWLGRWHHQIKISAHFSMQCHANT